MPLFACERCGCQDNSACGGTYWTRLLGKDRFLPPYAGELLCCVCAPVGYRDGSRNIEAGRWHGKFPRTTPAGVPVTMPPPVYYLPPNP